MPMTRALVRFSRIRPGTPDARQLFADVCTPTFLLLIRASSACCGSIGSSGGSSWNMLGRVVVKSGLPYHLGISYTRSPFIGLMPSDSVSLSRYSSGAMRLVSWPNRSLPMVTAVARVGRKKISPYVPSDGAVGMAYHAFCMLLVSLTVNYLVIPFQASANADNLENPHALA